jgi:hypothetical protein
MITATENGKTIIWPPSAEFMLPIISPVEKVLGMNIALALGLALMTVVAVHALREVKRNVAPDRK